MRVNYRCLGWSLVCILLTSGVSALEPDQVLNDGGGPISSVAFSPDSKRLVAGGQDAGLTIWDVQTFKVIRKLDGHARGVLCVSVSPDNKLIASGGDDRLVKIWSADTGKLVGMLEGHTGGVYCMAFLPDGTLVSGGTDGLRLWDPLKEKLIWKSGDEIGGAFCMSVTADGKRVAFDTYRDGATEVWDLVARKRLFRSEPSMTRFPIVAISPDGKQVVGPDRVDGRRTISRWDLSISQKIASDYRVGGPCAYSADGRLLVVGENSLEIHDSRTMKLIASVSRDMSQLYTAVALSPDSKMVAAAMGRPTPDMPVIRGNAQAGGVAISRLDDTVLNPQSTTTAVGPVSWDVIPISVVGATGASASFEKLTKEPFRFHGGLLQSKKLACKADAIWTTQAALLQKEPGKFRLLAREEDGEFCDATYDGKYIWFASAKKGLFLFDVDGVPVTQIGEAQGLPSGGLGIRIHPLSPGKLLVAGSHRSEGETVAAWVATLELTAGKPVVVNTIFTEKDLPEEWYKDGPSSSRKGFAVQWIRAMPPAAGASPYVLIACDSCAASPSPFIKVDLSTLRCTTYNLRDTSVTNSHAFQLFSHDAFIPLDARRVLSNNALLTLGPRRFSSSEWFYGQVKSDRINEEVSLLPDGKNAYVIGDCWSKLDTSTMRCEEIGPGLEGHRNEGYANEITYVDSAVNGMSGICVADNCIYRFSTDPAKPASVRATISTLKLKPVPPDGLVTRVQGSPTVICGSGALRINLNAKVATLEPIPSPWQDPLAALRAEWKMARNISHRACTQEGDLDRARADVTADQKIQFRRLAEPSRDHRELGPLLERLQAATDNAARDPIVAELKVKAVEAGKKYEEEMKVYITTAKSILTPRQWQILSNQPLPPGEKL